MEELHGDIEELKELLEEARRAGELAGESRTSGGRFAAFPWELRLMAMAELARGTPPSAVAQNMVDAAHLPPQDGG